MIAADAIISGEPIVTLRFKQLTNFSIVVPVKDLVSPPPAVFGDPGMQS